MADVPLHLDILRRLYRGCETPDSLRGAVGPAVDEVLRRARDAGDVVEGGSASAGTRVTPTLALSSAARARIDAVMEDASPSFLDPAKDDVGRRFALAVWEKLPASASGAAQHLLRQAAVHVRAW